jgi:hypothetical protein
MKITMESTSKIVDVNGVPSRLWDGVTSEGVRCDCFVSLIQVAAGEDQSRFQAEFHEMLLTQDEEPMVEAIDLRFLI